MKRIFLIFLLFFITLGLGSCASNSNKKEYSIQFDSIGGTEVQPQKILEGETIVEPLEPTKEGFIFLGWYLDGKEYDFSSKVDKDITLVAMWEKSTEEDVYTGYYSVMNNHFDETFKETLHQLLKETHKTKLSYSKVWDALKDIDQDPLNQDNIICIYTGRSIAKSKQDTGSAGDYWNREHSWPNSHGFSSKDYAAYTDLHHLFASEKNINATRENKDFNNVTNGNQDEYGNKWNNTYFEPRDEVKGDLARAMFYMVVRYDDPNELDLELSEEATSSSSNKTGKLGVLSVLLEWNTFDPVSEKEKLRNEKIFSLQGNRNPFIDHPEWMSYLYPNL